MVACRSSFSPLRVSGLSFGASLASSIPSGRQRPSFPRPAPRGFPFVRSVGAGLTTRSSERPLHAGPFCLVLRGAVAELESVRRFSSLWCFPRARRFPFVPVASVFPFASCRRFTFRGRRPLRSALPGGSAHHSPAGGKRVPVRQTPSSTRLTRRSSEQRLAVGFCLHSTSFLASLCR